MWTSIFQPTPLVSPPTLATVPTKSTSCSVSVQRRSCGSRLYSSSVPEQAQETEEEEKQGSSRLRGLDVLWAMQKAAAEKNKLKIRKKNKLSSSSSAARIQELPQPQDYGDVKPLCVKSDWGVKLDELERRLRQLSQEAK